MQKIMQKSGSKERRRGRFFFDLNGFDATHARTHYRRLTVKLLVERGKDRGTFSTLEIRFFLNSLPELLGVRVDGLSRACSNIPSDLRPILSKAPDCFDESLMLGL